MSEEPGQKERKDGVDFDSANIGKKQKATQFTIIEGAEERAKAAERAKNEAKKEAEELHQADIEAASARQAKAEEKQREEEGGLKYKLFGGWRKWLIIGIILLIGAGIASYFLFFKKDNSESLPAREAAKALYDEQVASIDKNNFAETYPPARDKLEEAWGNASDDDRFWYAYYYALFLREQGLSEEAAAAVMKVSTIPADLSEEERCLIFDMWMMLRSYDIDFKISDEDFQKCQ